MMSFPVVRMRRLRKSAVMRDVVAEVDLTPKRLVYPVFVSDQTHAREAIKSMPGVFQQSIDYVLKDLEAAMAAGVRSTILFGIPEEKDPEATSAWDDNGVIQRAVRAIKKNFGQDLLVITDTCLCEYMSHGHCGIILDGKVLNDPSIEVLSKVAVSQAEAGADIVAPSDMMDGRVMWIRNALDDAGYDDIPIMAYSAKYASGFYGPFRDAAGSAPSFGDRKTYQMDPRNGREAIEEVTLDIGEGADMILVKPAMAYLDILFQVRQLVNTPIAAYSVSGEYSMIKAAAQQGWIDEQSVVLESLYGIRRAGADLIITYHAVEAAGWLSTVG